MNDKSPHGAIVVALPSPDYEPPSVIDSASRSIWLRHYAAGVLSHAGWSIGKIARALRCSRGRVLRMLRRPEVVAPFRRQGASEVHAINPFEKQGAQHFFRRKCQGDHE